jgi:hypothetical protein
MKQVKVKSGTEVLLSTFNNLLLETKGYHDENKDSEEKLAIRHILDKDLIIPEVLVMNHDKVVAAHKTKKVSEDIKKVLEYFIEVKQVKENIIQVGFALNKEDNKGIYVIIIKSSDIEIQETKDVASEDEKKVMDMFEIKA